MPADGKSQQLIILRTDMDMVAAGKRTDLGAPNAEEPVGRKFEQSNILVVSPEYAV